jgi:ABC-type multidrug transport system fused ATPase/permease subunit
MYGIQSSISYSFQDLIWRPHKGKECILRVVFVKMPDKNLIFATTALDLNPLMIIGAYALRFKIETAFWFLKNCVSFFAHFWTSAMPIFDKFHKDLVNLELTEILHNDEFDLMERIHNTLRAVELAYFISVVALGALHMCALLFPVVSIRERYLRTGSRVPSPGTVAFSFRKSLDKILKHKEEHEFLSTWPKSGKAKNCSPSRWRMI